MQLPILKRAAAQLAAAQQRARRDFAVEFPDQEAKAGVAVATAAAVEQLAMHVPERCELELPSRLP